MATAADGTFSLSPMPECPSGLAAVVVTPMPGRGETLRLDEGNLRGSGLSPFYDIMIEPACAFSGRVMATDGSPIAGARVTVDPSDWLVSTLARKKPRRELMDQLRWWAYTAETGEDGEFRFEALPQGLVTLLTEAEGFRSEVDESVCTSDGGSVVIDVVLDVSKCWDVHVLDTDSGAPVAGASVIAFSLLRSRAGNTGEEASTDEDGVARICTVSPVGSSVEASAPDFATNAMQNYEGHEVVEIHLRKSGQAAGWTSPPVKEGSCAGWVEADGAWPALYYPCELDGTGRFLVSGLPAVAATLRVRFSGHELWYSEVEVLPGRTIDVGVATLEPDGAESGPPGSELTNR